MLVVSTNKQHYNMGVSFDTKVVLKLKRRLHVERKTSLPEKFDLTLHLIPDLYKVRAFSDVHANLNFANGSIDLLPITLFSNDSKFMYD